MFRCVHHERKVHPRRATRSAGSLCHGSTAGSAERRTRNLRHTDLHHIDTRRLDRQSDDWPGPPGYRGFQRRRQARPRHPRTRRVPIWRVRGRLVSPVGQRRRYISGSVQSPLHGHHAAIGRGGRFQRRWQSRPGSRRVRQHWRSVARSRPRQRRRNIPDSGALPVTGYLGDRPAGRRCQRRRQARHRNCRLLSLPQPDGRWRQRGQRRRHGASWRRQRQFQDQFRHDRAQLRDRRHAGRGSGNGQARPGRGHHRLLLCHHGP